MHDLLQSPGMVDTYDNIKRSDTLPVFKEQSLEDIQSRYQKNKDDSEEQQIRNLKALEEELIRRKKMGKSGRVRNKNAPKKAPRKKQNPSIVPTNFNNNSNPINKVEAPKSLVCDITLDLTKNARKGLASKKKKKTQIKSQKKKISRIFTKKYYDWIISTMEILGSNRGGYIYCELDEIYDAAREESVDMNRIESEIQKGLKANIFQTKHQFLMIKSM